MVELFRCAVFCVLISYCLYLYVLLLGRRMPHLPPPPPPPMHASPPSGVTATVPPLKVPPFSYCWMGFVPVHVRSPLPGVLPPAGRGAPAGARSSSDPAGGRFLGQHTPTAPRQSVCTLHCQRPPPGVQSRVPPPVATPVGGREYGFCPPPP